VLKEGEKQYAFELKRWRSPPEEGQILGGDYDKLMKFMKDSANHLGYSMIFTSSEN
jgi:hypothetical protein